MSKAKTPDGTPDVPADDWRDAVDDWDVSLSDIGDIAGSSHEPAGLHPRSAMAAPRAPSAALPSSRPANPAGNVARPRDDSDSGVIVIPNLDELSAGVQSPPPAQELDVDLSEPEGSVTQISDNTEPLAQFNVRPEEVLLVEDIVPANHFDPFGGLPPASEDVSLMTEPKAPLSPIGSFVTSVDWSTVAAPEAGPTTQYKEERLALLADELEAREKQGSSPEQVAWVAVEAARAADMAGAAASVEHFIDRACAADISAVAPRRERLRMFKRGDLHGPVLARRLAVLAADVSNVAGQQHEAYETLARALVASAGDLSPQELAAPGESGLTLLAAAKSLRAADVRSAATSLGDAGGALSGPLGAQLSAAGARLLEVHALGDRGSALRAQARLLHYQCPPLLMAALRSADTFSPSDTLAQLQSTLAVVTQAPLHGALGRWAACLAESQGNLFVSAELLSLVVDGKPLLDLRVAERICLLPLHIADVIDNPEGWTEGLPPEESALFLAAAAEMALRLPRESEAMELLSQALAAAPNAVFPAMLAERFCHSVADLSVRRRGLSLWAKGDRARAGMSLLELCGELAHDKDGPDQQLVAAQNAALAALPNDAAFLSFAWNDVAHRRYELAAQRLERGSVAFAAMGEPALAAAFRERAEDAAAAEMPTRAVVRAMARSSTVEETLDHPRALGLLPLQQGRSLLAVAATYRGAAMSSRQATLRVLEAVSWMKAAGQRREAIQFLQPRLNAEKPSRTLSMLLRLSANTFDDPTTAASVFEYLATTADTNEHRGFWRLRRAEALVGASRFDDAAGALGEVTSGPLAVEALISYRRVLWLAGSFDALDQLLRDESDGYRGVGQDDKAARVLVQRAHVRVAGLRDEAGGLALLQDSLALDPSQLAVAVRLLAMAASQKNTASIKKARLCMANNRDADALVLCLLAAESDQNVDLAASLLTRARHADPQRLTLIAREFGPNLPAATWSELVSSLQARSDGDPRLLLSLQFRAANALAEEGDLAGAAAQYEQLVQNDPRDLAALSQQVRVATALGDMESALSGLIAAASAASLSWHRAQLYLDAAALAGASDPRVEGWLQSALACEPGNESAFAQLRTIIEARQDVGALAELIRVRQQSSVPFDESGVLALERASLLARNADHAGAKAELRLLLLRDPQNIQALRELVELEYQDGAYSIAAEIYLRLARFEESAQNQMQIFRRLGRIYHRRLSDPKLAAGAFERVLKLDPNDLDALTGLSDIYSKQNDLQRAIAATERAVALDTDDKQRLGLQLRLAGLYEKNADVRRAGSLLRRAHEQAPRSLQAIGELARYLERHKDTQGRRVLLDTSLSRLHEDLRRAPGDLSALRAIVPVLRWCSRAAGSAASAQLLAALTSEPVERYELQSWATAPAKGRRLSPLVNPEVDEMAYPSHLPPGLRQVMRVLGPPLSKASRPDLKRYGVLRVQRVGVGEGPRAIIDALAVDLGVRGFEVFVTSDLPDALFVEPGDPPAIILGAELVKRGAVAVRFAGGYALRLVSTHFDLLAAPDPGPRALLTALVRQFLNLPVDDGTIDEEAVARVLPRLNKALGRSQRAELRPFVAEMASPESLANVASSVAETAARVGLLACGDLAVSVQVVLAAAGVPLSATNLGSSPVASGLFEFALSADYELLVRAIDSVS